MFYYIFMRNLTICTAYHPKSPTKMKEKKKLFRNKILKELYFEDSLSCAELSNKIEKSFPITAKLIEELMAENLIIETGYAASTGGRRAMTYSLQKNVTYLVSVAMDQFVTKIVIMDMKNNFVAPVEKVVLQAVT